MKLFVILGKLQRAHQTYSGHFAPAYLGGSNKLRAYQHVQKLVLINNYSNNNLPAYTKSYVIMCLFHNYKMLPHDI